MKEEKNLTFQTGETRKKNKGEDAVEEIEDGEMPLKPYLLIHPEANLSQEEKLFLIEGLKKTFGEE